MTEGQAMTRPAGWTGADEAELAVLIWAWIDEATDHQDRGCGDCVSGTSCPQLNAGTQALLDWYEARKRLSLAEWLRAMQNDLKRAA